MTPKLRGRRRPIPLALPPELVAELDRLAAAELRSRGMLIEVLIREALAVRRGDRSERKLGRDPAHHRAVGSFTQ